jgi:hypothetical protein
MEPTSNVRIDADDEVEWQLSDEELERPPDAVRGCYCLVNCQIPRCAPGF